MMAIDTSGIDIKVVIDRLCSIRWCKPAMSRGEIVYKGGPCPFCLQGTDRFVVFTRGQKPHFYCGIHGNGCGVHGDVIHFVQQLNGYASARQAIDELQKMGFPLHDMRQYHTGQATRAQPERNTRQAINKLAQSDTPQTTSIQPERGHQCRTTSPVISSRVGGACLPALARVIRRYHTPLSPGILAHLDGMPPC